MLGYISPKKSFLSEKYSTSKDWFIIIHITIEISSEPAISYIYTQDRHNEINLEMDEKVIAI